LDKSQLPAQLKRPLKLFMVKSLIYIRGRKRKDAHGNAPFTVMARSHNGSIRRDYAHVIARFEWFFYFFKRSRKHPWMLTPDALQLFGLEINLGIGHFCANVKILFAVLLDDHNRSVSL
jgi:hypothetical protein